MTGTVKNI